MLILLALVSAWIALAQELSFAEFHKNNLRNSLSVAEQSASNLLRHFNGTRVPGSKESKEMQDFIKKYFRDVLNNDWSVETDSFEENGFNFTNLVFTPMHGESYLVIAAHYDTKIDPPGFIGAMDSGASCAVLLYVAKFIDHILTVDKDLLEPLLLGSQVGLKIVFFDGEEAINQWGPYDSIYGSKHLARKWEKLGILNSIDLFVLMDLLGSKEQQPVHSYYRSSHRHYAALSQIEDWIGGTQTKWLDPAERKYVQLNDPIIDDDHRPFYEAGVSILHLIPFPFPATWHTLDDDFDNLDEGSIQKWALMMSQFVLDFLRY
ncbi:hypothetical protein HG536_0F02450 [Torulaspora globosa]|uniref:Peptide hydrolase n=1 Tax=Torulaspora globosa TaxID=48254 RepID=A0A7G3ZK84_9SACH|nr:uncharacterized protein HG536_0F02450 [Torulaspora globosa]QLL33920.1 hypothetical protein HG536_0F02450 [Torulaspora globosa]